MKFYNLGHKTFETYFSKLSPVTLTGIFKFHSKVINVANKRPRGQPSDVIVPDFPLSGKRNKGYFSLNDFYAWAVCSEQIQRNNYYHGSYGPSLTGKMMSVFLIFTQGHIGMSKIVE